MTNSNTNTSNFSLSGKVVVITGGSRGLGFSCCKGLFEQGASLAIFDIIEPCDELKKMMEGSPETIKHIHVDVTSEKEVVEAVAKVKNCLGSVDGCVCAAGVAKDVHFLKTSVEDFNFQYNVNTIGTFLVAQNCAKVMVEQGNGGSIVFVASIATYEAADGQLISAYTATKGAVKALVKPMAMELAEHKIRVNSISPGHMLTDMAKELGAQNPGLLEGFAKKSFLKRMGNPEDLQGSAIYLLSDMSQYYTGQDMLIDGGISSW